MKRAAALRSTGATESPGRVLHRLTRAGAAISILLLVSLAYNWNYLRLGFEADDVVFLEIVQQDPLPYPRGLGMWATDEMTAITNLWWFEGQSTTAFFRPVPSLVFEGMVLALGERAVPFHLFSILLHGLVAGSIFLLVRRLTGRAHTALLAGVVFLSFEDHSMGVAVITMMTDPLAVLFVNLALLAYAAWLSSRRFWCLIGSLALLVPAFLSKESAVLA
ncbi:MAG: glycosyltransferase family 39 protein, partial [Thermoanaerobaculia bacterium]